MMTRFLINTQIFPLLEGRLRNCSRLIKGDLTGYILPLVVLNPYAKMREMYMS